MSKMTRYEINYKYGGLSEAQQEALLKSKILVMGVGGLGSGVVMNLAALGVGQIRVVDCEVLSEQDLNRQIIHKYKNIGRAKVMSAKEWIQDYNPDIKVEIDKVKINGYNYFAILDGYDIIVDCFENFESKYILNEIAQNNKKILIHGSTQGFGGQVTTFVPGKTGCLCCVIKKPSIFNEEPVCKLSPVVNVISALQAQEVLKVITGCAEPLMNEFLVYDAIKSEFKNMPFKK